MRTLSESLFFLTTQVALLALVLSPAFCGRELVRPASRLRGVVFAACAVVLATAAFINMRLATDSLARHIEAKRAAEGVSLSVAIEHGAPFVLRLDKEACLAFNFGSIACDADYRGELKAHTRLWMFTGPSGEGKDVITNGYPVPPSEKGVLSLWGVLLAYNDDGVVRYINSQGVGTIQLAPRDRI
jgi:hypothetical protein